MNILQVSSDLADSIPPIVLLWITVIVGSALVGIVWKWLSKQDKWQGEVSKTLGKMGEMLAVHDQEIQDNKKAIEKLQEKVYK